MRDQVPYRLLQQWLILIGALVFGLWLAWHYGILTELFQRDATRICLLVAVLFIAATCHCGARSLTVSREAARFEAIRARVEGGAALHFDERAQGLRVGAQRPPPSLAADYIAAVLRRRRYGDHHGGETGQLTDIFNERIRGAHEFGWFVTGLLVKLGLLGTVIGFIIMLGAVNDTPSFDIETVQRLLTTMSFGMSVALYTTLVGLVASMLLGLQYLLLDRAADQLVARVVGFAEQHQHVSS